MRLVWKLFSFYESGVKMVIIFDFIPTLPLHDLILQTSSIPRLKITSLCLEIIPGQKPKLALLYEI